MPTVRERPSGTAGGRVDAGAGACLYGGRGSAARAGGVARKGIRMTLDPMELVVLCAACAAVGAVVAGFLAYALARRRAHALELEKAEADAAAGRVPELELALATLREQHQEAVKQVSETRAGHTARIEELERAKAETETRFKALAADALKNASENFLTLAGERFDKHREGAAGELEARRKAIETLVKPLGEGLTAFNAKLGEMEVNRVDAYRALREQVSSLAKGQSNLRDETGRLVRALRQPQTRGRWGEYQLRKVLELAGMSEHVDFVEQPAAESGGGRVLRPDVVIRMPDGKSLVVDAKTPLQAYLDAAESDDEEKRAQHLKRHADRVREHARALASKDYWKALTATPDFVVMFIPGEPFYAAALERAPELFEQAVEARVLICTPTTLIALVKAVAYGWRQHALADNAAEVAKLGGELFDRLKTFAQHMSGMGGALHKAVEQYNRGIGNLEARVLPTIRKFKMLGAAPAGEEIPALEQVETEPRALQSPELAAPAGNTADEERPTA